MNQESSIIQLTENSIAAIVPANAYDFQVATDQDGVNRLWYKLPIIRGMPQKELLEGSWTLLGKASELAEDDWKKVVESHSYKNLAWYRDYKFTQPSDLNSRRGVWDGSAIESGLSLLKSKSLDPLTTVILIKQP